jgi:serine/threonine-protein kinase
MSQIQIGETLGSFRIESVLGSGAMGVVYRATNEKTSRVAAVKVLGSEFSPQGSSKTKLRDRFEREAKILEQFRHPGIVRFLAVGRFRGTSYFAMEYVEGETLEKVINERGALPWREVVDLGIQICDALHYAHERGIVHRDLKPSNLMLTADGKVKLTDFGIAKDLDATALTATGRTLGTAAYMAPEQIRGTPAISHKTDLYALGIVLFQLLTGRMPFEGNTPVVLMHSHLNEMPPRPSTRIAEIPKALDELVVNLMAKTPGDRPWDAAAAELTLTTLRDKAERGAAIAMVWPSSQPASRKASLSADSGGSEKSAGEAPRKKSRRSRSSAMLAPSALLSSTGSSARTASGSGLPALRITRATIEIGLLVVALAAVGGFIVYWLYPPSADYLYHQAERLMASKSRHDWATAREDYLDPLDARFPNHPHRDQTQKWRDQILLNDADARATVLSSPVKSRLNQPLNVTESQFVVTFESASAASGRGDDLRAKQLWEGWAQKLKTDDPEQRLWYLLAVERAKERDLAIRNRRQFVESQLDEARLAKVRGKQLEAATIENTLFEQFGHFTDLADLFENRRTVAPAPGTAPATAASAGSSSSPPEEPKSPGAEKPRQANTPQDTGSSERSAPPTSNENQERQKPAADRPKTESGAARKESTSSESSNTSPPNSVPNG